MCSSHELQATLNALGYLEDDEYFKGRDCLNGAKDLVRYLRRDDPSEKTVRRELLKSDVISNDLIPLMRILKTSRKDAELYDIVLRLLVNLTQSAFNCFEMKVPEEKVQYNIFLEIDNRLKSIKQSFANEKFFQVITDKLNDIAHRDWQERPEEDDLVVERILYLIRNVLLIKSTDEEADTRLGTDLNIHDLLVINFHKTNLLETLIKMISNNLNVKYTVHILEIITLLLNEQSPEELAKISENEVNMTSKRSVIEKEKDTDELAILTMKDNQMRKYNKTKLNPRHSRFMGTYVVQNMKSINDENKLIVHKAARNMDDLLDDSNKKAIRKAKNKMVFENDDQQRKSVLFVRIILKIFCTSLINKSYGVFFKNLKDMVQRKKLEDEEMCYYYWLIQFLTEFIRHWDVDQQAKIDLMRETFSLELFHSIEVFIQRCYEMIKVDKKQNKLWAQRMHTSLRCYKESLLLLFVFEKKQKEFELQSQQTQQDAPSSIDLKVEAKNSSNSCFDDHELIDLDDFSAPKKRLIDLRAASNISCNNASTPLPNIPKTMLDGKAIQLLTKLKDQLFYIQEFRELFINMLREFDSSKMSKNFLRDIIEANHIFTLMLENQKKAGELNVALKKKKKQTRTAKKSAKQKETKEEKEQRLRLEKEYKKRVGEQDPEFKKRTWDFSFIKIADLLQNKEELLSVQDDNLMPFDFVATSDQEFDTQKDVVIEKIQRLLVEKKPADSVALFREARCLWPNEPDVFGAANPTADDEFEAFKNLFMRRVEIKRPDVVKRKQSSDEVVDAENDENIKKNEDDEGFSGEENNEQEEQAGKDEDEAETMAEEFGDEEENENDENEAGYVLEEESLDFEKFLFRYTHPHILKCFILMLGEYTKNSDFVNRCCMSVFERIAYDCHAPQYLYQLSLFKLINCLYKDPLSRCIMNIMDTKHANSAMAQIYGSTYSSEDMFAFFRQLMSKFFEQAQANPKLYIEVLFFKDKKIISELGEDSGGYQPAEFKASKKVTWTEKEQDELKELFERFKPRFETEEEDFTEFVEKEQNAADIIDLIILYIKDESRKRRDICNQLVNLKCVNSIDVFNTDLYRFKGKAKQSRSQLWRDNDIADLRHCFELVSTEAKQEEKPLSEKLNKLQECLKVKRTRKNIVNKLTELKLVELNDIRPLKKSSSSKSNKTVSKDGEKKFTSKDFISDIETSSDEAKFGSASTQKKEEKKKKSKEVKKQQKLKKRPENEGGGEKNDLFDAESESSSDEEPSSSEEQPDSSANSSDNESESETRLREKPPKSVQAEKSKPTKRRLKNKQLLKIINGYSSNEDEADAETELLKLTNVAKAAEKMNLEADESSSSSSSSSKSSKSASSMTVSSSSSSSEKAEIKKKKSKVLSSENESMLSQDGREAGKFEKKSKKRTLQLLEDDESSNSSAKSASEASKSQLEKSDITVDSNESATEKKEKKKAVAVDSDTTDSDEDEPLSSLASSNKRQKLILEDDEE